MDLSKICSDAKTIWDELIDCAPVRPGQIVVIGCSTSEVAGERIGTHSVTDIAKAIARTFHNEAQKNSIKLAAQCCEHLNRALIVERQTAISHNFEIVNAVPQPKAGGAFATAMYARFSSPVAVEFIKADAGIDIGDTFIGMHLKHVAVPTRLTLDSIGHAHVTCAKTRPKFIGGERALYL